VEQRLALRRRLTPPSLRRTEGPPQLKELPHFAGIRSRTSEVTDSCATGEHRNPDRNRGYWRNVFRICVATHQEGLP